MGRVSATFKPTVEKITKAYADWNGISFSESVEILTSLSAMEWWEKLPFGAVCVSCIYFLFCLLTKFFKFFIVHESQHYFTSSHSLHAQRVNFTVLVRPA